MSNFNGLTAGLGHAVTVSHAAQRLSEVEIGTGWTWGKGTENAAASGSVQPERHVAVLQWVGDNLILLGAWLKARSGSASYQHA
jgi:hypothetical protein